MKVWTPKDLVQALKQPEKVFLLDIRDTQYFDAGHIEGKKNWEIHNVPYRTMAAGWQNAREAIQTYLKDHHPLPKEENILVVCAQGISSKVVASALSDMGHSAGTLEGGMFGWRNHYEQKEIIETEALSIYQFQRVARGCLSYLVKIGNKTLVIDPSRHIQQYLDRAVQPIGVFDTHAHADHISGARFLANKWDVPYFLHPYDAIHPMDLLPAQFAFTPLWEGKTFSLEVLHIPGHTLGNCAFLLNDQYLFTGDSIFLESISRPDLGGQTENWSILHYQSLRKLLALSDELLVLPAHFSNFEEVSKTGVFGRKLGELKQTNKGLLLAQGPFDAFNEFILSKLHSFPPHYIDIKRVNLGLLDLDEETATLLEQGKNVCSIN